LICPSVCHSVCLPVPGC